MNSKITPVVLITILEAWLLMVSPAFARPGFVLHRDEGSITFAVDEVKLPGDHLSPASRIETAKSMNLYQQGYFSAWKPEILSCSFADAGCFRNLGEDVVFQMLVRAWTQHRPVVLSPDVIWLLICQQFSYHVNNNAEALRDRFVMHEGKMTLEVDAGVTCIEDVDWGIVAGYFFDKTTKNAKDDLTSRLVADFSTTGRDELIASQITMLDVVKPYYEYVSYIAVCGIPSITLTGTPDDWRKVLDKTRLLEGFGLDWWIEELKPILQQFITASVGKPDYWFWKSIVRKTSPQTVRGLSCGGGRSATRLDGWFLKLFPFDSRGRRTGSRVSIGKTMPGETVVVPFKFQERMPDGFIVRETALEFVAGIVGVQEDTVSFALTPKIGWYVRTVKT